MGIDSKIKVFAAVCLLLLSASLQPVDSAAPHAPGPAAAPGPVVAPAAAAAVPKKALVSVQDKDLKIPQVEDIQDGVIYTVEVTVKEDNGHVFIKIQPQSQQTGWVLDDKINNNQFQFAYLRQSNNPIKMLSVGAVEAEGSKIKAAIDAVRISAAAYYQTLQAKEKRYDLVKNNCGFIATRLLLKLGIPSKTALPIIHSMVDLQLTTGWNKYWVKEFPDEKTRAERIKAMKALHEEIMSGGAHNFRQRILKKSLFTPLFAAAGSTPRARSARL